MLIRKNGKRLSMKLIYDGNLPYVMQLMMVNTLLLYTHLIVDQNFTAIGGFIV